MSRPVAVNIPTCFPCTRIRLLYICGYISVLYCKHRGNGRGSMLRRPHLRKGEHGHLSHPLAFIGRGISVVLGGLFRGTACVHHVCPLPLCRQHNYS